MVLRRPRGLMGMRGHGVITGKNWPKESLEIAVSGRKMAEMRQSKEKPNFQKKRQVFPFMEKLLEGLRREV